MAPKCGHRNVNTPCVTARARDAGMPARISPQDKTARRSNGTLGRRCGSSQPGDYGDDGAELRLRILRVLRFADAYVAPLQLSPVLLVQDSISFALHTTFRYPCPSSAVAQGRRLLRMARACCSSCCPAMHSSCESGSPSASLCGLVVFPFGVLHYPRRLLPRRTGDHGDVLLKPRRAVS